MTRWLLGLLLTLAPVPWWNEPAPVGSVIRYGESRFKVAEIRRFKCGVKCYRMIDPDPVNEWKGWWVSEKDILLTLRDPAGHTWKRFWDTWSTPDGDGKP